MGRPGGRRVVSGLNSILYQTHLYLHKQEACLLGRESTAIHFLSGCLAGRTTKKLGRGGSCGDGCERERRAVMNMDGVGAPGRRHVGAVTPWKFVDDGWKGMILPAWPQHVRFSTTCG